MYSSITQDKDGITTKVLNEETVCIPVAEYRELVAKADRLDMIAEDIRRKIDREESRYNIVDEELVRVLTGTADYEHRAEGESHE